MEHSSKVHKRVVNNFLGNINHFYHYEGPVTYNGTVNYNAENGGRQQDWAEAEEAEFEEAADLAPVKAAGDKADEVPVFSAAVGKCFRNTSAFVREKVKAVAEKVYNGSHANLALMEVALYDHGLLRKRNAHTVFVRALAAWDIIQVRDEKEIKLIIAGITDKFNRLPDKGYLEWDEIYVNDRNMCINIGGFLGSTIKYIRN